MNFINEINISPAEEARFQENYKIARDALTQCQNNKNLQSCLHCATLFTCSIREHYVQATYESMSKGQEGAFDFN